VRAEFTALVNPGRAIPPEIAVLTGISDTMVAHAPPMTAVLPRFLDFARGRVLIAHHAAFDVGFLSAACTACGVPWPACQVLDTVVLARQVLGEDEVPNHKLSTLASFFGAGTPPCHRALADARATADVLAGLLRRLAAAGVRTFAEICELGRPELDRPEPGRPELGRPELGRPELGRPTAGPLAGGTLSLAAGTPGPVSGAHSAEGGNEWSPRSFW
jgi:DNA polymerase III subunit epsilon